MRDTEEFLEKWWAEVLRPLLLAQQWNKACAELETILGCPQIKTHLDDIWDKYLCTIDGLDPRMVDRLEGGYGINTVGELLRLPGEELLKIDKFSHATLKRIARLLRPIEPLWDLPTDSFVALRGMRIHTYNDLEDRGHQWVRETFQGRIRGIIMRTLQERRAKSAVPQQQDEPGRR